MTTQFPSITHFSLSYEGDALSGNSMAVRDLAPAILSLVELFERANYITYGDRTSVELQLVAIRPGSIELSFALLLNTITEFLSGGTVTSAANLIQLIFGGRGLVGFLKRRDRQGPISDESSVYYGAVLTESLSVEVGDSRFQGDLSSENMSQLIRLVNDELTRQSLEGVMAPLSRNGIERLNIREGSAIVESIDQEDLSSLSRSTVDGDFVRTTTGRQLLKVISPSFGRRGLKWRLSNGPNTNWYSIEDDQFMDEVLEGNRSFSVDDILICDVNTTQWIDNSGDLKAEFRVLHVIEHTRVNVNRT